MLGNPANPHVKVLALKALLGFPGAGGILFVPGVYLLPNPARLPGAAQWVNVERIRVKDLFTRLWWMSTNAVRRQIIGESLKEYSEGMKNLLASGKYNPGKRPSEHNIGGRRHFLKQRRSDTAKCSGDCHTQASDPIICTVVRKRKFLTSPVAYAFGPSNVFYQIPDGRG